MIYHVDMRASVNANISSKQGHDIANVLKNNLKVKFPEIRYCAYSYRARFMSIEQASTSEAPCFLVQFIYLFPANNT